MKWAHKFVWLSLAFAFANGPAFASSQNAATSAKFDSVGWTWPAYIAVPLFLSLALYLVGFFRLRYRAAVPISHLCWFLAGWASLLIALDSPVHELSEQLFWVHMVQHEILMVLSAPLLVMGRPLVPFLWALPRGLRGGIGTVSRSRRFKTVWLAISAPLAAWLLHGVALWLWHAPALFDAALRSDFVHAMQHISFFATALLFWWALVHGHHGRMGYGGAVVYVFTTALHMSLLSFLLVFSPRVWYAPYALTTRSWNLTPLQDQQLGGLIMWIPAGTILMGIALFLFWKWLEDSDRRWRYTRTAAFFHSSARISAGDAK